MDPINKMLHYINTENSENTNAKISEFVISNLRNLETLSITDFAEQSFVSPATITRYIQALGFENFASFKKYFGMVSRGSKQSFFKLSPHTTDQLFNNPTDFLSEYIDEIYSALSDTVKTLDYAEIDQLIDRILSTKNVAILAYSDANVVAKDIQLGFLVMGKIIQIAETEVKLFDIIQNFDNDSLVIILSNYGNFFQHFRKSYLALLEKKTPIICVTQNYSTMDTFVFDNTIYLNSKRYLNVGNYPMRLFSDYLLRRLVVTRLR